MLEHRSRSTVVAAILSLGIAGGAAAAARPVEEALALIPSDAVAVATVQWRELRASGLYRECEERYAFGHDRAAFAEVVDMIGVDPETDVDAAILALRGGPDDPDRGAVGIVTGRFDRDRVAAKLAERSEGKLERTGAQGSEIFRVADGDDALALAMVRDGLLLFGDEPTVALALAAARAPEKQLAADSGLRQAYERAPHEGQVWGAVALDAVAPHLDIPEGGGPNTLAALRSLRWASFNLEFGADLAVTLTGEALSGEQADLVQQALMGVIAFGKLGADKHPEVQALLAETSVERAGRQVTFRTVVGADMIEAAHGGRRR